MGMMFFHGTDVDTATALSVRAVPVDVAMGGGEFGRGFYVTTSRPLALRWALGRFSLRARVVEVEIDSTAYLTLKRKCLSQADAKRLTKKLRRKRWTKTYLCGADVVVGPIQADGRFEQEKFETDTSQATLNNCTLTQLRVFNG